MEHGYNEKLNNNLLMVTEIPLVYTYKKKKKVIDSQVRPSLHVFIYALYIYIVRVEKHVRGRGRAHTRTCVGNLCCATCNNVIIARP